MKSSVKTLSNGSMNRLKALLILFCVNYAMDAQQYIELKDNWNFSSANENQWRPAEIPGNIFSDLERQNIIQNPLLGTNEKEAQWVSQQDWEYKIDNIQLPELKLGQHFQLTLPELDTYADIYWNNQFLIRTDNAFRTWKVKITQVSSINQLRLSFH